MTTEFVAPTIPSRVVSREDILGGGSADTTPPTVDNFSPAPGSAVFSDTAISFDVKDDTALRHHSILVLFNNGDYEVAFDGTLFSTKYSNSTRTTIPGGYSYTLRRSVPGWDKAFTIKVNAIDTAGNAA